MKYRFMNEQRYDYAITLMCRVLRVAQAGFYAWLHASVSGHVREKMPGYLISSALPTEQATEFTTHVAYSAIFGKPARSVALLRSFCAPRAIVIQNAATRTR